MRERLLAALITALALGAISEGRPLLGALPTAYWLLLSYLIFQPLAGFGLSNENTVGTALALGVAGVFLSYMIVGFALTFVGGQKPDAA